MTGKQIREEDQLDKLSLMCANARVCVSVCVCVLRVQSCLRDREFRTPMPFFGRIFIVFGLGLKVGFPLALTSL